MLSFVVLGAWAVQRANVELSTQLASSEGAVPDLTKAVKPDVLYKVCQEIAAPGLASPANAKAVCQRKIPDDKTLLSCLSRSMRTRMRREKKRTPWNSAAKWSSSIL